MMCSARRRFFGVMLLALAFGVTVSVIKGNNEGIRQAIGNTSAPWLLLPFIAGAVAGRRRLGLVALIGTLASVLALGGFYVANTFVLDLGPHPWVVDLHLTVDAGKRYLALGVLSGPIFGALGGLWQRAPRPGRATAAGGGGVFHFQGLGTVWGGRKASLHVTWLCVAS